jgi:drug/metabolite transporter (DMT)-like permease
VTAAGDAAGIFASLFMALYLMGSTRRGDMKLLSWMFPLHCVAAVVTGLLAMAGGATLDSGPSGLFLFAADGRVFLATLGSVALPSFICHTLANWLASGGRLSPFLVSIALCLQPLTGNIFGWLLGLQGTPSTVGLSCAPLVVAGCVLATVGGQRQRARDADADAAAVAAAAEARALESPPPQP